MGAPKWPLTADRGATFTLTVRVTDDDGTPRDLTGHTATLKRLAKSTTDTVLSSHAAGTLAADGYIAVTVPDETTAAWDTGRHSYRLELVDDTGSLGYVLVGPFTVRSPADV